MILDIQKANMWKRISAFIFDAIIFCVVAVGCAYLMSAMLSYDAQNDKVNSYYEKYEQQYGIDFDISSEDYNNLSQDDKQSYDDAYDALASDKDAVRAYSIVVNLTLIITSFGILLSVIILDVVIPLIFKNGQTLGKKIFGLCVMREDGIKLSPVLLVVRSVLGKYTIEIMVSVLMLLMVYFGTIGIVGLAVLAGILILQIILLFATSNHTVIHDLLSHTIVVDYASQMIFDSVEEQLAYKKKIHSDEVARADY